MSEVTIAMSLPLDSAGFLRRECPNCQRQFKWRPAQPDDEQKGQTPPPTVAYFCPYCYEASAVDAWWTQEQLAYARQLALAETVGPSLRRLGRHIQRANRPGGLIRIEARLPSLSRPDALTEPDDMVRVDFPCHPEEPLKINDDWQTDVACLVCGIRYPVELVCALPDEEPESETEA